LPTRLPGLTPAPWRRSRRGSTQWSPAIKASEKERVATVRAEDRKEWVLGGGQPEVAGVHLRHGAVHPISPPTCRLSTPQTEQAPCFHFVSIKLGVGSRLRVHPGPARITSLHGTSTLWSARCGLVSAGLGSRTHPPAKWQAGPAWRTLPVVKRVNSRPA
jgi:hypothetical protein